MTEPSKHAIEARREIGLNFNDDKVSDESIIQKHIDAATAELREENQKLSADNDRLSNQCGMTKVCHWTVDDDGLWSTSCGQLWVFHDGTPKDNGMNFCHSCGAHLMEEQP